MNEVTDRDLTSPAATCNGVAVGLLLALSDDGQPLVAFAGGPDAPMIARSTIRVSPSDIGSQVALMFENGRADRPMVIGKIVVPGDAMQTTNALVNAKLDEATMTLSAEREIVLRCGDASITLKRDGKIEIRGTYVLSRSSGANKVKGASVQIN